MPPFAHLPRHLILTATADLTYDQRMQRQCAALAEAGYQVTLVGREKVASRPLAAAPYHQHRLRCWFPAGKFFYLEFNLRLLVWLLRQPAPAAYTAVDLDTALPVWLAARLKRRPWLYDAHELFTEVPEVVARPRIQRLWRWVEGFIVPRATAAYTVGPALAEVFRQRYGRPFGVVRNVPDGAGWEGGRLGGWEGGREKRENKSSATVSPSNPQAVPLFNPQALKPSNPSTLKPSHPQTLLYQGALNVGRGLEELLDALPLVVPGARLVICGEGDLSAALRARVAADPALAARVEFRGYVVPAELRLLTRQATVGTMLLQNRGLSYYYSLANKFFDYVQAGVPQVCIDFPEYRALNQAFEVAELVPDLAPGPLAAALNRLLTNESRRAELVANCRSAARVWSWEREAVGLVALYAETLRPADVPD